MTAVEWLIDQLRQLAHNPSTHLGMGDIRITQGMLDDFEEKAKQMEKNQTEISDDEIDKQAALIELGIYRMFFKTGAKWYREQLKMRNETNDTFNKEQENFYWEQLNNDFNKISDEDILKAAKECVYEDLDISVGSFELGARWYREQLKNK